MKISKFLRIFTINGFVLIVLLGGVEIVMGSWSNLFADVAPSVLTRCRDPILHHRYCPGLIHVLDSKEAGRVISYINQNSLRVATLKEAYGTTNTAEFDVINIGDSYMQADEIEFDDTLSSVMSRETGKKVLQVGDGSWAPAIYLNFLRSHELKRGVTVNVFAMANDFTKNYSFSNIRYHSVGLTDGDGNLSFAPESFHPLKEKIKNILGRTSYLYEKYLDFRGSAVRRTLTGPRKQNMIFRGRLNKLAVDCDALGQYDQIMPQTLEYVRLAFSDRCWDAGTRKAVDSAVMDLKKIYSVVSSVGGRMNVVFVAAGWAMPEENSIGKTMRPYLISAEAVITAAGVVHYLSKQLPTKVRLVSSEDLLIGWKSDSSRDSFHFPVDGHWTPRAHARIGKWLADNGFH